MRTQNRTSSLLRAGLVLAVTLVPVAGMPGEAAKQSVDDEHAFLRRALGVNELELQLGHLATERATKPEVKAMAGNMVQKHTQFGSQLSELAKQSGLSGEPKMSPDQQATLARLRSAPASSFDSTFKQVVDDGHVNELAMYKAELSRTADPQLRALAEQRVAALDKSMAGTGQPKEAKK